MDKENVVLIHNGVLFSHKKNEILSFSTTWMELEVITLSEISQAQKYKHHRLSKQTKTTEIMEIESGRMVTRGWEGLWGGGSGKGREVGIVNRYKKIEIMQPSI